MVHKGPKNQASPHAKLLPVTPLNPDDSKAESDLQHIVIQRNVVRYFMPITAERDPSLTWAVLFWVLGAQCTHTQARERLRKPSATARGACAKVFASSYADAYASRLPAASATSSFISAESFIARLRHTKSTWAAPAPKSQPFSMCSARAAPVCPAGKGQTPSRNGPRAYAGAYAEPRRMEAVLY